MVEFDLVVGDEIVFEAVKGKNGKPVKARVVGVFTNLLEEDNYWYHPPTFYSKDLLMDDALFEEMFMSDGAKKNQFDEEFIILPDYKAVTADKMRNSTSTDFGFSLMYAAPAV